MAKQAKVEVSKNEKPTQVSAVMAPVGRASRVTGFGVEKLTSGRYLAVRVVSTGEIEVLTPKRHQTDWGESKALAWQRALDEAGRYARRRDT